jgi:hypothetical protein
LLDGLVDGRRRQRSQQNETMIATGLLAAVPFSAYAAGRARSLLYLQETQRLLEVDAHVPHLLSLCQGGRTFDGHLMMLTRSEPGIDPAALRGALDGLVREGLLRSCSESEAAVVTIPPSTRITTVGIITADRPDALKRCAQSIISHCDPYGRRPAILIVDGSRQPQNRAANRQTALDIGASCDHTLSYVGPDEIARLCELLARGNVPNSLLSFALSGGTAGCNRNVLLLLSAGQDILTVDDDVVFDTWTLPECAEGLTLSGHSDEREWNFFRGRREVVSAIALVTVDLLAAHEALLGQPLHSLVDDSIQPAEADQACTHMLSALRSGRGDYAVRATFTGIAGDSGTYCSGKLLFSSGSTKERLTSSRLSYELAMTSREVLRIAKRNLVTHDSNCMATCMGLSNRTALPPFMPVGRNQDGVFGATLGFAEPTALFGHLRYGVLHESDRAPAYSVPITLSASQTRVSDLVLSVLGLRSATLSQSGGDRLRRLGNALHELSDLKPADFWRCASGAVIDAKCQELARTYATVAQKGGYPDYWVKDLDEYRRTFVASAVRPDFGLPIEFRGGANLVDGFRETQSFCRSLGDLCGVWPTLWESARSAAGLESVLA